MKTAIVTDSNSGIFSEGRDVSSSQPTLGNVMDVWDSALSSGYDEIVYIPMSSGLSGSCQTAAALAKEYGGSQNLQASHNASPHSSNRE